MPTPAGETPPTACCGESKICHVGDMSGDGVPDVVYTTIPGSVVYIYKNAMGQTPAGNILLATELNTTSY